MTRYFFYILFFLFLISGNTFAQFGIDRWRADESVRQGLNEQALTRYKELLDKNVNDPELNFNAGNALYELKQYEPALQYYERALQYATHPKMKSDIQYNMANCLFRMNQIEKSAELYKQALKKSPDDPDAKFNYEFLMKKMQQQGQKQSDKDKKDKNKNQDKQQQNQSDQNKNQDQQKNKQNQNKEQDQQQQQKKNQQTKTSALSKEAAERLLDLLKNQELDYQRKNLKEKLSKESKTDKDW